MQNEITYSCEVPAQGGTILNPGWARSEVMHYNRANVKAPWFRKKEWDYYLFTTDEVAVAFTISDLGYVGLLSASFLDLKEGWEHTESELGILPRGKKYGLGERSFDAHGECHTKRLDLVFSNVADGAIGSAASAAVAGEATSIAGAAVAAGGALAASAAITGAASSATSASSAAVAQQPPRKRHISCNFRKFHGDKDLVAELDVYEPDMDGLFIATPWKEKATAFYYNLKKNCLTAEGFVKYGDREVILSKDSCAGVLDWGRGVWTYDNTWYWGTGSGFLNGELFGFNLGYGFSDRSLASENALYYRGRVHKLEDVEFRIPHDNDGNRFYTEPWQITSNNGKFEAVFKPIMDRSACMNFAVIISDQHQVFGRMTGKAVLEDGTTVEFKDFVCALEVVRNKY